MAFSRRDFLSTAVVGAVSLGLEGEERKKSESTDKARGRRRAGKRPIIVSADNGFDYLDDAFAFLKNGGDTLDAALRVVKGRKTIPTMTASDWAACRTKKAWSNSTPAACTGPRGAPGRWAACAISRMFRWLPRP